MTDDITFLYVEDDPESREIMEILLVSYLGFSNVFIFEDSQDFVDRLEALPRRPDLFFLDIHMKPVNGFTILNLLREHDAYSDSTVIAVTASVMNEEVQMLKDSGFDGAIAKPVDQDAFPSVLKRILAGEEVWRITG